MALDSIYRKKKIEELKETKKKMEDAYKDEFTDINRLIDDLPKDNDYEVNENSSKSDMDIERVKEDEKREFTINTNQPKKEDNVQDTINMMDKVGSFGKKKGDTSNIMNDPFFDSLNDYTTSFSPVTNTEINKKDEELKKQEEEQRKRQEEENNNRIKAENINKYVEYSRALQGKYGRYYKAMMNEEEANKRAELLSNAYGYSKELIEKDIERYKKDVENEEDYKKIVEFNNNAKNNKIEGLKARVNNLDNQITELVAFFEPYRNIPFVDQQISKVISKNNEINNNPIIDSENDYNKVIEMKTEMINYLIKAKDFIEEKTNVEQSTSGMHNHGHIDTFIVILLVIMVLLTFILF